LNLCYFIFSSIALANPAFETLKTSHKEILTMAKETEATAFEPLFSAAQRRLQAPALTSSDLRAQCEEASSEGPEPKSAKELAALYGVSDRALQDWFKTICTAYIWIPLTDLKSGNSNKTRYTVLCQDLLAQYREAAKALSADA
jgi:hypothetical protein